ncbi:MAG: hydrogen peroxide-inducible genes activator [Piscirickettsiaceae bacterium]|nr:hydrogen peroxide-inducible genes activator [Piscirickettsiaceae bacterium]
MSLPTLRQLHYLTAVAELKHFGRAADKCFVTQSTLSAGIQDLEHILGVALLERTNRKVLVTAIGEQLTKRAQHILSLSADMVDLARSESSPLTGRIRIGVIPSISPFLLPKALPKIRKKLAQLELVLIEDQSERLLKQLKDGEIDVAILALPFDIGDLEHKIFAQESFWVALPKHHSLAKNTSIHAQELPTDDLLLLSEGHCLREHALSACQLPMTTHRTSMQGTSLYTLIEMVAGGLGITLIPEMAIDSDMVSHADICIRPLVTKGKHSMRELGLIWRPSYQRVSTIEQLAQIFADALTTTVHSD